MAAMTGDDLLNPEQAAAIIGIASSGVRRFCRRGDLPAVAIGRRAWAIRRCDAERFAAMPRKPGRKAARNAGRKPRKTA